MSEAEAHDEALDLLRLQHAAAIHTLKTSFQYRLGEVLTNAVTSSAGARHAPRALWRLGQEAWAHKKGTARPVANWHGTPERSLIASTILDELSDACLAPEFKLDRVTPGTTDFAASSLLFAESAWSGNGGAWQHAFSQAESPRAGELHTLVEAARAHAIPTVFWNKEDPINYDVFRHVGKQFDWTFTTDVGLTERYKKELGHDQVGCLMFGAQPAIHNPIGTALNTASRVAFAGAWRAQKYPWRETHLRALLQHPHQLGILDIYDRNASHPERAERFPQDFASSIVPTVGFLEMSNRYRDYLAFLNVNSVTASPTMLSRRVFEVLACRTPLISAPSKAIETIFGDMVLTADTTQQTQNHIDALRGDRDFAIRTAHLGYRHVHSNHTYAHRVDGLLETIGIDESPRASIPPITVICVSNRPAELDNVLQSFTSQVGVDKSLLFVANSADFDSTAAEQKVNAVGGRYIEISEQATLGQCLNQARTLVSSPLWAKFDDDDYYGPHHLHDLGLAYRYTRAAMVGRRSYFMQLDHADLYLRHPNREFQDTTFVAGGSFVADTQQTKPFAFEHVRQGTDTRFMIAVRDAGLRIFAASRFNYLMNRSSKASDHTWKIGADEIAKGAQAISTTSAIDHVTV